MRLLYILLILLLPIGLSNCTEIQKKISDFTSRSDSKSSSGLNLNNSLIFLANESVKDQPVQAYKARGYYILADGTYSTSTDYVVPQLNTSILEVFINRIRQNGGGYLWLSYIDNKSRDNETLFMRVTCPRGTSPKPNFMANGAVSYKKLKLEWETKHLREISDSLSEVEQFSLKKKEMLYAANSMLRDKVYIKSVRNELSDVSGSVESAIKILSDAKRDNVIQEGILIGFSDFENDPVCMPLKPDPTIRVFNLISQPGKSKNCVIGSQEIMDIDYLLSILKL